MPAWGRSTPLGTILEVRGFVNSKREREPLREANAHRAAACPGNAIRALLTPITWTTMVPDAAGTLANDRIAFAKKTRKA